jgi:prophage DNA circulation protein
VALSDIIGRLVDPIIQKIKDALGPFGKMFDLLGRFWNNIKNLNTNVSTLVSTIVGEISAWRNFKESLAYKNKVINLRAARDSVGDFIDQIKSSWLTVKSLIEDIKGKFETTGNPTEEAEQAIKDIEESGFREILAKFPKLIKGAEKVLGFVAIVADALESIIDAVADLQEIAETCREIREQIQFGKAFFLQQGNSRRTVTLDDGTKMKIRVGNLHE